VNFFNGFFLWTDLDAIPVIQYKDTLKPISTPDKQKVVREPHCP